MKIIIGILSVLVCLPLAAEPKKMSETISNKHLFEIVDKTVKALPFADLNDSGQLLSMKFSADQQPGSNEYFKVYMTKSSIGSLFSRGELRADFKDLGRGQLINLDLKKPLLISKKDFDSHFKVIGQSMGLSSAHDVSEGVYVSYKLKRAQVRVGFVDLSETQIRSISIDSIEKK